ncbi:Uncharacterised protein [Listeria grayi]|uniref:Uncharacterized protein n=1 Tax=Listeria grayi TaxID=1641 RepID=A0A378MJ63_LISGR|nr:hypothetical protein [Listeria grayi]STY45526.1 Uncharacterised protein [Listeria grayi]
MNLVLASEFNFTDVIWSILAPLILIFLIAGITAYFIQRRKKKRIN